MGDTVIYKIKMELRAEQGSCKGMTFFVTESVYRHIEQMMVGGSDYVFSMRIPTVYRNDKTEGKWFNEYIHLIPLQDIRMISADVHEQGATLGNSGSRGMDTEPEDSVEE